MQRWALAAMLAALVAPPASATLIGDEISARWQYRSFDRQDTFLVGAGIEGNRWQSTLLDIGESSISIDYALIDAIGQAAGTIWTFSDLDWVGSPGEIIDFRVSTNWTGWSDDFVSFGADWLRIELANGVNFDGASDFFLLDLAVRHADAAIPEPSAALVFGLGAIVLGGRLRRSL